MDKNATHEKAAMSANTRPSIARLLHRGITDSLNR